MIIFSSYLSGSLPHYQPHFISITQLLLAFSNPLVSYEVVFLATQALPLLLEWELPCQTQTFQQQIFFQAQPSQYSLFLHLNFQQTLEHQHELLFS
jgi:hypothetical protein